MKKLKKLGRCRSCDLRNVDLEKAVLKENAFLMKANLTEANLTGAWGNSSTRLTGAIFCRTKLPSGIDNSGC